MKSLLLRILALLTVLCPVLAHAAAPANDKFANATPVPSRVTVLRNQNGAAGTAETLDPYLNGSKPARSLWYRVDVGTYSAGNHAVITHAAPVGVGIFKLNDADGGAGSLTFIAQGAYAAAGTDSLGFALTENGRYYICVECNGLFDLKVKIGGQSNDFFEDAALLPGAQGTVNGSNTNATDSSDVPSVLPATAPSNGVWYKWVAPATVQMAFETNFSYLAGNIPHDTVIAVFTGTALTNLVTVAFDDDHGTDTNSRVSIPAVVGTTYYLWVGDYGSSSGPFTVSYYPETSPGIFDLVALPGTVGENQGFARLEIRRRNAGSLAPAVTVTTSNVSATAGADYTAVTQLVTFSNNPILDSNSRQFISVPILTDALAEGTEQFNVTLSAPTLGATLGTATVAIGILDDPVISAPGFTTSTLRVHEGDGYVSIPIQRGNSAGNVFYTVTPSMSAEYTARMGVHYYFDTITSNMLPGQTTNFLYLNVLDNGLAEGDRTLALVIQPIYSNVPINGSTVVVVTITDDDTPLPAPGRLSGVFRSELTGSVDLTVTAAGTVTGKLTLARAVYPFTGKLDAAGTLAVRLAPVNGVPTRTLMIRLTNSSRGIYNVTLNDHVLASSSTLTLTATNFSALNPCPNAGLYTFADSSGGGSIPQLLAGSLKADALGNAVLSGKLFDGTAFVANGAVDISGTANIGATLYAGQGRFACAVNLPTAVQTLGTAYFDIMRPGRANQAVELPGFTLAGIPAYVSIYTPPAAGTRMLSTWNPGGAGFMDLDGGGYGGTTTQALIISVANTVTLTGAATVPSLKLALVPATGLYTGSVIPPAATAAKPIYGVVFQAGAQSVGRGFFLNSITPGSANFQ